MTDERFEELLGEWYRGKLVNKGEPTTKKFIKRGWGEKPTALAVVSVNCKYLKKEKSQTRNWEEAG